MLYRRGWICSLTNRVALVSHNQKWGMKGTKRGTTYSAIHITWEGWLWKAALLRSKGWGRSMGPIQIPIPKASWPSLSIRWLRANSESSRKLTESSNSLTLLAVQLRKSSKTMCRCQMKTWIYRMKKIFLKRLHVTPRSLQLHLTWVKTQLDKTWSWCTKIWPQSRPQANWTRPTIRFFSSSIKGMLIHQHRYCQSRYTVIKITSRGVSLRPRRLLKRAPWSHTPTPSSISLARNSFWANHLNLTTSPP